MVPPAELVDAARGAGRHDAVHGDDHAEPARAMPAAGAATQALTRRAADGPPPPPLTMPASRMETLQVLAHRKCWGLTPRSCRSRAMRPPAPS
ncbi:hypothetical protein G6F24_017205 [Rhizopus arrhizus]|nr:hypothetical protein G6F24_017205 [Rhizopus arrhizus]